MSVINAWVVSANMGLGHNRAAYPFSDVAYGGIYHLGGHSFETRTEKFFWRSTRKMYETLSRSLNIPVVGPVFFSILDNLQKIPPYYPVKDRSSATTQVKHLYRLIRHGLGNSLVQHIGSTRLPVITTFYASALAVEELTDLPVYCIICDADINRAWVPIDPKAGRTVYFAPCAQAKGRLLQYGVPENRIHVTGFPLPDENVGGSDMPVLKKDLGFRLNRLDPSNSFRMIHGKEIDYYLGKFTASTRHHPAAAFKPQITLTYAIGGAGAQKHIADEILCGAKTMITEGRLKVNLVAGIKREVYEYLSSRVLKHGLGESENVSLVYDRDMHGYFSKFSNILHTTDILWSKPSELSFYCSLGIPFITSPPIGAQEKGNLSWLSRIGARISQPDPCCLEEWLSDYLSDGTLARCAWNAFLHTEKTGKYKILDTIKQDNIAMAETATTYK